MAGERGVRESDPFSPHGPELGLGDEGENVEK